MKILSVKLKSVIITMVVILLVVFGIFMTAHTLSDAVSGEARMIPIYNVDTPENKVAVTFNCAVGNSDIDSILSTLDKYNIRATFFLLGSWADDYMEEVQKIYDAGHEIGNHGYSHKDLPTMNYENIMLDIQKCNETVRNITGHSPTLFRAPSGAYDNKTISAAENLGMVTLQWDAEPPATFENGYIEGFFTANNTIDRKHDVYGLFCYFLQKNFPRIRFDFGSLI